MSFQREHKSLQRSPKIPQDSSSFALQPQPGLGIPLTPAQKENQVFQQQKFEATKLQLKQKYGSITPPEQEHLGVLQAKMNEHLAQRVERESRFGHNFAKVAVTSPDAPVSTPIQPKLTIGQQGDRYEQEADSVAHQVVSQINQPQPHTLQRKEMPEAEDAVWMNTKIAQMKQVEFSLDPIVHHPTGQTIVQRVLNINNERITHASRKVNDLYNQVVLPRLEQAGYKTYGIKSKLVEFIRNHDVTYQNVDEFWTTFSDWLTMQTRKVKGDKATPVLKPFDVKGMARPSWTEQIKEKVGFQCGDNIRHVVRNATLKKALDLEFSKFKLNPEKRNEHFTKLANGLGVSLEQTDTIDIIIKKLYSLLYLNVDNLFSGEGPTNQVIGFSADPVQAYGEELLAMENEPVNLVDVHKKVMNIIYEKSAMVKASQAQIEFIHSEINEVIVNALGSLLPEDKSTYMASAEAAGDIIVNIGLNFGFDLIDGRVERDQTNIAERQGRLLGVEMALQEFIKTEGKNGSLLEIFSKFIGI